MDRLRRINTGEHPWYDELHKLEMEVLDPKTRGNPDRLDLLLRSDFVEFGSSGRVYHKNMLIDMMVNEQHAPVLIRDFNVRDLAGQAALVTYRTVGQSGQEARRSSVWVLRAGRWQMVFHQGTRIPGSWSWGDRI